AVVSRALSAASSLADDRDDNFDVDLWMQRDVNFVIADRLDRPRGKMNFGFYQLEAGRGHRFGDVARADRTEHGAVFAYLAYDLHRGAFDLRGARACAVERIGLGLLQLRAAQFELGFVLGVRNHGLAVRNQVIARKTGAHFDLFAEAAEVTYFFQQNNFHRRFLSGCRNTATAPSSARI